MTYVQYIDCDKWKKVIGITLWAGATIGLSFQLSNDIGYELNHKYTECHDWGLNDIWRDSSTGKVIPRCYLDQTMVLWSVFVYGINIFNYFMISYILNAYYQWFEIRCGTKPDNISEKESRS